MGRPGSPTDGGVLRRSVLAQRGRIAATSALFIGHQAGEALVPLLIGVVLDQAITTGDAGALAFWLAVLAVDFLLLSSCYRFGARVGLLAGVRADRVLRLALAARVLDGRGGADADLPPGALVSIATADVRRTAMVNYLLPHGIAAVVGVVVAGVALLTVSLPLGLLILLGTPPVMLLVRALSGPLERRAAAQQEQAAQAAGVGTDLVRGVRVVKGLGAERAGVSRYRAVSRASLAATLHTSRAEAGYSGAVIAVNGVFLAVVALVGGGLAAAGEITAGNLVSAVGLAQFLLGPLGTLGEITASVAAGRASATRIAKVLDAPPAVTGGGAGLGAVAGRVGLTGVTGGRLAGLELTVEPGELVCVVTADPGEAMALRRFLGREADPEEGRLTLDGTPLTDIAPDALRTAVLVSPHDADLFEGTVQDNILAGGSGDVSAAVRAAQVDRMAAALPDGLATAVTERGRSLSGGQRQRVALARALHADPPVLVLHDPTTAVDAVTEAAIAAGLRDVRAGRTTIVLCSSPALLAVADRVVYVERGTVTASGEHAGLLRDHEGYRELILS
ncbi:ABC transporter ATP-binding protein [Actinosynnema sp. NPDC047251]|uniref:Putative membrane protein n=1 Tax=Saccharothrix espanaensis (strain ATCC 51144 / DSM 44229 / JCM 9112 / NBRC 15066 / NRRL 15764) TaxID=1179773 RepID=K0K1Q3_SACES|nr:ABC transporter ATP-binding protein [Saccharothrix espanaensis]CCH30794.1 putative membrane protein [Saccharothrix espanaensis DSM 44229]